MKDHKIIELIRDGKHSKALDRLYKINPKIEKLILAKGGSKEDAGDIFQEALVVFCQNATKPDFTLTATISTYLHSVCRYMWNDRIKKRKPLMVDVSFAENGFSNKSHIETYLDEEDQSIYLDAILKELGSRCAQVLEAYYFEKMSMQTIADRYGYTSDKVARNQKYKCLERAKKMAQEIMYNQQTQKK